MESYLEKCLYPAAERIYVSPLKRCIQTAKLIYPTQQAKVIPQLAECDFGLFENKNYRELSGCPEYQAWIDSSGTLPFPEGESREAFQKRSVDAFEQILKECREEGVKRAALVVHGGTIMSIMEQYAYPRGDYYDYQVGNGEGYELRVEDDDTGIGRIHTGSDIGRSQMAVSSGQADRPFNNCDRTNYQKLIAEDEML